MSALWAWAVQGGLFAAGTGWYLWSVRRPSHKVAPAQRQLPGARTPGGGPDATDGTYAT